MHYLSRRSCHGGITIISSVKYITVHEYCKLPFSIKILKIKYINQVQSSINFYFSQIQQLPLTLLLTFSVHGHTAEKCVSGKLSTIPVTNQI